MDDCLRLPCAGEDGADSDIRPGTVELAFSRSRAIQMWNIGRPGIAKI